MAEVGTMNATQQNPGSVRMTCQTFTDVRGRQLIEVYRRQGQRRPGAVKGKRLLFSENVGMDGRRDVYLV